MIAAEIRARGPMPLARYMALALGHPEHGYYQRREPFGTEGDFVSAPEISQMFGEVLGAWLVQAWCDLGRPAPLRLVELGPGRGTLMADLLRTFGRVPDLPAPEVHLVETSRRLRAIQRQHLADQPVAWHDSLDEVPPGPMLLVANEFLDALPVHQLEMSEAGWVERCVGLDAGNRLAFTHAPAPGGLIEGLPAEAAPGTIAEVSPVREAVLRAIAARLAADAGVALLIDYGAVAEGPSGDTLQALRERRPADPLVAPGEADLTTQVEFGALARAAAGAGAAVYGPVPQGAFLRAMGIEARALALMQRMDAGARRGVREALFRLSDASAMGELFKVLVLAGAQAPPPPGFSAPSLAP